MVAVLDRLQVGPPPLIQWHHQGGGVPTPHYDGGLSSGLGNLGIWWRIAHARCPQDKWGVATAVT